MIFPEALKPGDRVRVVAPSSGFPAKEFLSGLAWLHGRYRLEFQPNILARDAYLAGNDERRLDELSRAFRDDRVKAIVCARGGYGATRIAHLLPWDEFKQRPKWIVGFSDVTALHLLAQEHGVASVHGANVTGLGGRRATPWLRHTWMRALEQPLATAEWSLNVLHPGSAKGVLVGGNLALVHAQAAAGMLHVPKGAVVALEDVTEKPYRIDRMLTSLLVGGAFAHASAIVFGEFTECGPGPDGRTVDSVLSERTATLGIPVFSGAPFGHGVRNDSFALGRTVEISDRGTLRFLSM